MFNIYQRGNFDLAGNPLKEPIENKGKWFILDDNKEITYGPYDSAELAIAVVQGLVKSQQPTGVSNDNIKDVS